MCVVVIRATTVVSMGLVSLTKTVAETATVAVSAVKKAVWDTFAMLIQIVEVLTRTVVTVHVGKERVYQFGPTS